ncbi:MAG: DUF6705 family protein [Daejeonella sp.]
MKNLALSIIFLIASSSFIKAQQIEKGKYYSVAGLKNFEGTWQYINGLDTFKIILQIKKTFLKGPDIYMDQLHGIYSYAKAGKRISSNNKNSTMAFGNINTDNLGDSLESYFEDVSKNKRGIVTLIFPFNKPNEVIWKLKNKEMYTMKGKTFDGRPWDPGFSVPEDVILKKAK